MRSLAITLYILVLGCLLLISFVVEEWGVQSYKQDISEQYLDYATRLTPIIEKDMLDTPNTHNKILPYWSKIIDEGEDGIQLISLTDPQTEAYIETLDVNEQSDFIHIISPLSSKQLNNHALSFTFYDSYSDSLIIQYYLGRMAIYVFMTLVLTLIAWLVYRYISQISQVAKAVSSGNFDTKMPNSRFHALQNLATDINNMAQSIEDKNTENLILTGAIHHELRIPITRIRLALDILIQMKSDTSSLELLTDMDDDLEELSSLMEELLTISRLRLSGVALDKESVSLSATLGSLVSQVNNNAIALTLKAEFTISANRTLIERALSNIINNGIKYSKSTLAISSRIESGYFILMFEDDGIGIPENERALILKPFYRTDKSRNRHTGGFGLGLAIADLVIKDSQGHIKISQSALGGAAISIHWKI
jgi:signal transduction histidine kinase